MCVCVAGLGNEKSGSVFHRPSLVPAREARGWMKSRRSSEPSAGRAVLRRRPQAIEVVHMLMDDGAEFTAVYKSGKSDGPRLSIVWIRWSDARPAMSAMR